MPGVLTACIIPGIGPAGVPPYGACANYFSGCDAAVQQDLQVCVNDGTTTLARVSELLPESTIVVKSGGQEVVPPVLHCASKTALGSRLAPLHCGTQCLAYNSACQAARCIADLWHMQSACNPSAGHGSP